MEYNKPLDTMTALFQLKHSINLSRIAYLIDSIEPDKLAGKSNGSSKSKQLNDKNEKKMKKFDSRIREVAQKFINNFYI